MLHWDSVLMHRKSVIAVLSACLSIPVAVAADIPEGKGKADFERICGQCHGVEVVVGSRMSEDKWAAVVDDMVGRGAQGTQDELDRVTHYLGTAFGPSTKVSLNKATANEIATGLGIPVEAGMAIVSYREKNGPIKDWQTLEKVPSVDTKKFEEKKDKIDFTAP